jgi:hypothetical protein
MVTETYTYWMYIDVPSTDEKSVYITVLVDNKTVHATIALNALSLGSAGGHGGAVGAAITQFNQVLMFEPTDVPPGFEHNSIFVENCVSITFGMSAAIAWGFAVATLMVHG